jgi:hypothetical protein
MKKLRLTRARWLLTWLQALAAAFMTTTLLALRMYRDQNGK